jgi:hypothetical protein
MTAEGILQNASGWRDGCIDLPAFEGGAWGGRSEQFRIAHNRTNGRSAAALRRICEAHALGRLCVCAATLYAQRLGSGSDKIALPGTAATTLFQVVCGLRCLACQRLTERCPFGFGAERGQISMSG